MTQFKTLEDVIESDKPHRLEYAATVVFGPSTSEDGYNLPLFTALEDHEPEYIQMLAICNGPAPADSIVPPAAPEKPSEAILSHNDVMMDYIRSRGISFENLDTDEVRRRMAAELTDGTYFIPGKPTPSAAESSNDEDDIDLFEDDPDAFPHPPEVMAAIETTYKVVKDPAQQLEPSKAITVTPEATPEPVKRIPEATPVPVEDVTQTSYHLDNHTNRMRSIFKATQGIAARNIIEQFQQQFRFYKPESKTEFENKAISVETGQIIELAHAIRLSNIPQVLGGVPTLDWMRHVITYEALGVDPVIGKVIKPWHEERIISDGLFKHVNSWRPSGISPMKGNTDALQAVVLRACNDDPALAHHITQMIGYSLRNRGRGARMVAGIILLGDYGTGKSTLIEIIKRLFGCWNVADVEPQHVQEKHSGFVEGKTALVLEDIERFSKSTYNGMKRFHTDSELPLRKMKRDVVSTPNHIELILVSCNHVNNVYLPKGDRRYTVCNNEIGLCDEWVYQDLKDDSDLSYTLGNGLSYALDYFLNYDLTGFNPYRSAIDSEPKAIIQGNDVTGDLIAIQDLLEEWASEGYDQFIASTIRRSIKLSPRYNAIRYLYEDLKTLGCKRLKRTSNHNIREYIYQIGRRAGKGKMVPKGGLRPDFRSW